MLTRLRRHFVGQAVLGRVIRLPLKLVPSSAVLPVLSGPNKGLRWMKSAFNNGCWLGTYERAKATALQARVGPGMVVWDLGANVGYYALAAARSGGQVHCFEPVPRNLEYLRRHLMLNALTATVHAYAVGTTTGTATFDVTTSHATGRLSDDGADGAKSLLVEVKTVSAILQEGVPEPDVVKIDIEGAETEVLPALLETLAARPVIYLATHGPTSRAACRAALDAAGYRVSRLEPGASEPCDEWLAEPPLRA